MYGGMMPRRLQVTQIKSQKELVWVSRVGDLGGEQEMERFGSGRGVGWLVLMEKICDRNVEG